MKIAFLAAALASAISFRANAECQSTRAMEDWNQCIRGNAIAFSKGKDSARDIAVAAVESCPKEMLDWWHASNGCPSPMTLDQEDKIKRNEERRMVLIVVKARAVG